MSVPRTVAEVLKDHVTLEVEGIDRMYLNVYVPALQRAGGIASFFRFHRGHPFASSALMDPMTKAFVASMEQFAKKQNVPMLTFEKGQRKDGVAAAYRRLKALEAKAAQERLILTEDQVRALERAREEKVARGEIETGHPIYLGAQDTYYVGAIKGIGRIYQQTFIDTCTKVAFAKLYDRKNALVAADILNDRVLPFCDENGVRLLRVLTGRGTEYCGNRESHEYQLYLAVEDVSAA
jgi:hypothetical protein